ncbi:hypothetical protein Leryth_011655 [Lithospermum erythrorhizon]|nr:hypothetical protein Leryth_011655 [Lithospermum erythrorhizon]
MKTEKQNKWKKSGNVVGNGKVTPVQVAFIVDRYLSDNEYTQTRSVFRSQVSNLLSRSPVQEAPKSLLSLSAILDEYIRLKEQRVVMEQERVQLEQERVQFEQEKMRVQNLLKGMQDAMNVYNQCPNGLSLPPAVPSAGVVVPHMDLTASSKAGHYPVYNSSTMMSTSRTWGTHSDRAQFSTPSTMQPTISKRKDSTELGASTISKRSRKSSKSNQLPIKSGAEIRTYNDSACRQSIDHGNTSDIPSLQGSTVVKCLFNQSTQSPPTNPCPKTPPLPPSSQAETAASPVVIGSSITSSKEMDSQQITSTNSTIISSQTIQISPVKQISYCSIERNQSISISSPSKTSSMRTAKRDHVKGRLNFDASDMPTISDQPISDMYSTPGSGEGDILDLELPNLDSLGADFNLSDLLFDFDLHNDGSDFSGQATGESSPDTHSGSPYTFQEVNYGANQVASGNSKAEDLFSDEAGIPGPGCVTTIKSMTKCVKIISPVKRWSDGSGQ